MEKRRNRKKRPVWRDPDVTLMCIFYFLLGAAAYKWVLWRWLP